MKLKSGEELVMMTPAERFLNACRRKRTDRPPVWLMRQAGRHLPEYQELRARHHFLEMLTSEDLIVEISLQPWRRYQMDGVIVFSDILLIPSRIGMELLFLEGQGPKFSKLVQSRQDMKQLKKLNPSKDIPFLLNALRKIKREIGKEGALIGFAGSPWTTASYICQDFESLKERDPDLLKVILERLVEETTVYLMAQIEAGIEAVQIFDSWGGSLKGSEYEKWSAPYIQRIIENLSKTKIPVILYVKESADLLKPMIGTGCSVISIGWDTSLEEAKKIAGGNRAIQGNFNPHILMQATPDEIRTQTKNMLQAMKDYPGYIANLGHGVLPKTPVENVEAFVSTVKKAGEMK